MNLQDAGSFLTALGAVLTPIFGLILTAGQIYQIRKTILLSGRVDGLLTDMKKASTAVGFADGKEAGILEERTDAHAEPPPPPAERKRGKP